jgi:adenylate cyclase
MNESFIGLPAWLTQAGLDGAFESEIVSGFCDRCVAAGLPLDRALVFIDTLHPVHEGRLFRWGPDLDEPALLEYGRTSLDALAASGSDPAEVAAAERWRRSAFYRMLQTGDSLLRRRVTEASKDEFAFLEDIFAAGMTDYVAIIVGFAAAGTIGEMDAVYSAWATRAPDGFNDAQIAALQRIAPYLALAIKSVSLVRMTFAFVSAHKIRFPGNRDSGSKRYGSNKGVRLTRQCCRRAAAAIQLHVPHASIGMPSPHGELGIAGVALAPAPEAPLPEPPPPELPLDVEPLAPPPVAVVL